MFTNLQLSQPLHCLYSQQHELYYNLEQRKERLDKEILQDNLRTRNYS